MSKTILDLCGGTGAWSKPYADAGYNVKIITLPEYNIMRNDIGNNKIIFYPTHDAHYSGGISVAYSDIYGILAAPPCTEFSLAKNGSPIERNFEEGMQIVHACLKIIWACQQRHKLNFWALENPLGLLRRFLGRPKYTFRQWEFGDPGVKPTDIWGYFNEPRKTVFEMPEGITKRYKSGKVNSLAWAAPKHPGYEHMNLTRADLRAITPVGFAKAFYKANAKEGGLI